MNCFVSRTCGVSARGAARGQDRSTECECPPKPLAKNPELRSWPEDSCALSARRAGRASWSHTVARLGTSSGHRPPRRRSRLLGAAHQALMLAHLRSGGHVDAQASACSCSAVHPRTHPHVRTNPWLSFSPAVGQNLVLRPIRRPVLPTAVLGETLVVNGREVHWDLGEAIWLGCLTQMGSLICTS